MKDYPRWSVDRVLVGDIRSVPDLSGNKHKFCSALTDLYCTSVLVHELSLKCLTMVSISIRIRSIVLCII